MIPCFIHWHMSTSTGSHGKSEANMQLRLLRSSPEKPSKRHLKPYLNPKVPSFPSLRNFLETTILGPWSVVRAEALCREDILLLNLQTGKPYNPQLHGKLETQKSKTLNPKP